MVWSAARAHWGPGASQIIWNAWLSALLSQVAVLGAPAALAGNAGHAAAAAAAGAAGHSVSESVMASVDALDVPLVGLVSGCL